MDEREFKVLTKHCFYIGRSANQAEEWLRKCYATIQNALIPTNIQICRWYEQFETADIAEPVKEDGNNVPTNQNSRKSTIKVPQSNSLLCDICGRIFLRAYALNHHRLTHSEIKGFTCGTCGKQFHDGSNLRVRLS